MKNHAGHTADHMSNMCLSFLELPWWFQILMIRPQKLISDACRLCKIVFFAPQAQKKSFIWCEALSVTPQYQKPLDFQGCIF